MAKVFTIKQQKFIEAYTGNATEAARIAGYKHPRTDGAKNMTLHDVQQAIQKRNNRQVAPLIANRQQRQEFWTGVMMDNNEDMRNRLKASEHLARSEADFTDKIKGDFNLTSVGGILDELDRRGKHGSG